MSDEDIGLESASFPFDKYLTVLGLLKTHYGVEHGEEIYELLKRSAQNAAEETGVPCSPGIIFDDDGGEFVGLERPDSIL
jgi:hypothetical protein